MSRVRIPTILLASTLSLPHPAMATEEPRYDVVDRFGEAEVRSYPSILWAETTVETASYDPPWTPWFRSRNEVMVEILPAE